MLPIFSQQWTPQQWFSNFFLTGPISFRKITKDPHILAHVNTECLDEGYAKIKNSYLRTYFR